MISKNKNTQKYEAKLLIEMSNKLFIAGIIMLASIGFMDEWIHTIPTLVLALVLIYKSVTTNKKMLLFLDDLENKEEKG